MSRTWSIIIIFNLVLTMFCSYVCIKVVVFEYRANQAIEKIRDSLKDIPRMPDYPWLPPKNN